MADDQTTKKTNRQRPSMTPEQRQAQRRPRFTERMVPYTKHARRSLRRLMKIANTTHYDYTQEEAESILKAIREDVAAVERAFRGAPKEKGLFDL